MPIVLMKSKSLCFRKSIITKYILSDKYSQELLNFKDVALNLLKLFLTKDIKVVSGNIVS